MRAYAELVARAAVPALCHSVVACRTRWTYRRCEGMNRLSLPALTFLKVASVEQGKELLIRPSSITIMLALRRHGLPWRYHTAAAAALPHACCCRAPRFAAPLIFSLSGSSFSFLHSVYLLLSFLLTSVVLLPHNMLPITAPFSTRHCHHAACAAFSLFGSRRAYNGSKAFAGGAPGFYSY